MWMVGTGAAGVTLGDDLGGGADGAETKGVSIGGVRAWRLVGTVGMPMGRGGGVKGGQGSVWAATTTGVRFGGLGSGLLEVLSSWIGLTMSVVLSVLLTRGGCIGAGMRAIILGPPM